jgi:hypothetical protein
MAIALGKAGKLANRTVMFPDLPRVMAIALGKGIVLPSANLAGSRQRIFLKKGKTCSRQIFSKKTKNFAESPPDRLSAKIFQKKLKSLPRAH